MQRGAKKIAARGLLAVVIAGLIASFASISKAQQDNSQTTAPASPTVLLDAPRSLSQGAKPASTTGQPEQARSIAQVTHTLPSPPPNQARQAPAARRIRGTTQTQPAPGASPVQPAEPSLIQTPEGVVKVQPFESPETPAQPAVDDTGKSQKPPAQPKPPVQPAKKVDLNPATDPYEVAPTELYVRINVPHNKKAVESLTAYPFPLMPPKIVKEISPLPTKRKDLKSMLLSAGYTSRWSHDVPYPPSGWRFQYAFQAAMRRSGLGYPHTIIEIYPWINNIMPYIRPQIELINKTEEERKERYDAAVSEYQKKYFEIQNEATRKGLFAIGLRFYKHGQAYARIPTGTWWIAGTHKVPGLMYYWQLPVTVAPGTTETVELNENNALFIQGGW
jgi:hypothetical protein